MHWEKQHSVHQSKIRLTLELDAFREKKMPTWLKRDKSMTKLASKWVDNRSFAPREIESNAIAKFWRGKQRVLCYFWKRPIAVWITTS